MSRIIIDNKELISKEGVRRDQEVLLSSRIDNYIAKDHLARLVVIISENINFESIPSSQNK
jgi:hypothetical protein